MSFARKPRTSPTAVPNRRAEPGGFSLLEVMVAMLLTSLVLASMMTLLTATQEADVTIAERSETERLGQLAIGWIQRDLRRAGVGYADMIAPMPLIVPRDDGGIEVRYNPTGTIRLLQMHVVRGGSQVHLAEPGEFEIGDRLTVYDSSGNFQISTVTAVMGGGRQIRIDPAAVTEYRVDRGGAIASMEVVRYFIDEIDGRDVLMRQANEDPAAPLADDVTRLEFVYFDDSSPAVEFVPDSDAAQLRITAVRATLWIDRDDRTIGIGSTPSVRLSALVLPRALSLLR